VIRLSSVLLDGDRAAIYVVHSTFLEYLHSMLRDLLIMTILDAEALMVKGCLKVLSSVLKYNICGILQPSTNQMNKQMNGSEDERCIRKFAYLLSVLIRRIRGKSEISKVPPIIRTDKHL